MQRESSYIGTLLTRFHRPPFEKYLSVSEVLFPVRCLVYYRGILALSRVISLGNASSTIQSTVRSCGSCWWEFFFVEGVMLAWGSDHYRRLKIAVANILKMSSVLGRTDRNALLGLFRFPRKINQSRVSLDD